MTKEELMEKGGEAAWEMFESLAELVSESAKEHLENMPEITSQLLHEIQQIQTKQQQFINDFNLLKKQLESTESMNKLLENAGKTNEILCREHYDEHIIQPIVRSLFPVFDLIEDASIHAEPNKKARKTFGAILSQLKQFLAAYDVKASKHKTKVKFNPAKMRPVKFTPAEDKELDGLIAESIRCGFILSQTRVLRYETVSLFKYRAIEIQTVNSDQGAKSC